MDKEAAQLKFDLTVTELKIRRQELELAMRTYGLLDTGLLGQLDDLIQRVIDHGPDFGKETTTTDIYASRQAAQDANSKATQDAIGALANAAQKLQQAIEGLLEYQKSLRTDPSLGLVNSRQALDNAQAAYVRTKALAASGDVTAMEQFKDVAATYLRLQQEFTPSSGLVRSTATDIDSFITMLAQRFGAPASAPYTVDHVTYGAPFGGPQPPPVLPAQQQQQQVLAQGAATEGTLRQLGIEVAGMRVELRTIGLRIAELEQESLDEQKRQGGPLDRNSSRAVNE
jgi:hypothetical protein